MSDNGVFVSEEFSKTIQTKEQGLKLSGVRAQHQNGISERSIRTVTEKARTMMIHAFTCWPDTVELDLWPFVMSFAVYLWNRTPVVGVGLCPEELFSGVQFHTGTLTNAKVWGCPAFVLDPSL